MSDFQVVFGTTNNNLRVFLFWDEVVELSSAKVELFPCVLGQLPTEEGLRAAGRPGCLPQQEVRTRDSARL